MIGSGNYSIVVHPVVLCDKSQVFLEYSDIDNTDVCKIFKKGNEKDFHHEVQILKRVRNIPSYTLFTPAIKGSFSCKFTYLKPYEHIDTEYSNVHDDVYNIIFSNGGIPLNKITTFIPFATFMQYFKQFILGIQSLQENNIVHRDIKPTNVLLSSSQLNLIDFGLSCSVEDVYKDDDDTNFILSYIYMYHPPEFYVIHLIYEQMRKTNDDFDIIVDIIFNDIIPKQLMTYYEQHYYRYFKRETYNIFSYKKAFESFYNDIKKKNIHSVKDLLSPEFIFKTDVFGISFILKTMKQHIVFHGLQEIALFNTLYDMTYALNPYERCSIKELSTFMLEKSVYNY